jgi:hypothetical protein
MEREPNLMLPTYAMFLLAQFREQAAYPLLTKFFSTPGDLCLDTTGDVVTEYLGRILASVCHNELEPIKRMIEDPAVNEYVRSACLRTLTILVLEAKLFRDQVIDYFRDLFHGKLARDPDFIWSALVVACCRLYPKELLDDIELAYDDDLVDLFHVRMEAGERQNSVCLVPEGRGCIAHCWKPPHTWESRKKKPCSGGGHGDFQKGSESERDVPIPAIGVIQPLRTAHVDATSCRLFVAAPGLIACP